MKVICQIKKYPRTVDVTYVNHSKYYRDVAIITTMANIIEMLPASVKKMIRRKSLQCSVEQEDPTTEQYIYRRHIISSSSNIQNIQAKHLFPGLSCWAYSLHQHYRYFYQTFATGSIMKF